MRWRPAVVDSALAERKIRRIVAGLWLAAGEAEHDPMRVDAPAIALRGLGAVSGLFFGFAFGMGGRGGAALGVLADATTIDFVYRGCAFLPLLGTVAIALPKTKHA